MATLGHKRDVCVWVSRKCRQAGADKQHSIANFGRPAEWSFFDFPGSGLVVFFGGGRIVWREVFLKSCFSAGNGIERYLADVHTL